jgi:glycosyltransferase involved in cell wall biosynthesis
MVDDPEGQPLVSIVVPTFNAGAFLLEAIESVRAQTYPHVELIVVDDGSTDGTPELLARVGSGLTHVRQANAGQSAALNAGWARSRGDLLGYLSADDRLHPRAVEEVVAALLRHPHVALAYPDFHIIDEASRHVRTIAAPDYDQKRLVADFQCLPGPGALFRRTAWARAGGWDVGLRNIPDLDFYLRLGQVAPFVRVPLPLADFRVHAGSTTYRPCDERRADEPLTVVRSLYQTSGLPAAFQAYRRRATASALMLSGFMHGHSGRYGTFIRRCASAFARSPSQVLSRRMLGYVVAVCRRAAGGR